MDLWMLILQTVLAPFLVNAVSYVFKMLFDEWLNKHRKQCKKLKKRSKRKRH